jgi:hypothetical protein
MVAEVITCPVCGALAADPIRHRRWHVEEDDRVESTLDVLRPLVRDLEARAQETP